MDNKHNDGVDLLVNDTHADHSVSEVSAVAAQGNEAISATPHVELYMNITPQESRVAVLENGVVQEVHIERSSQRGIVGNIYLGEVTRVLPGMEAAFVEIGHERSAFLHASDLSKLPEGMDDEGFKAKPPSIKELIKQGDAIMVQVVKEPMGTKGARLTSEISLPSSYLVIVPSQAGEVGISNKITDADEQARLTDLVNSIQSKHGMTHGVIIRTAADGINAHAIETDLLFLNTLWKNMLAKKATAKKRQLLHSDFSLSDRILRDYVSHHVDQILVDSRETYQRLKQFTDTFVPKFTPVLEHYPGARPIFDIYNIDEDITNALNKEVRLKSGGYLILDQTESMTTIDVNTGGFVGHHNLEETTYKTNLEAVSAITRQLRLRNLGGIIIIDFIDMIDEAHKQAVIEALENELSRDLAKTSVCEISPLGLVEMTRKRTRESLQHILCAPCDACDGKGYQKTPITVCYEIFREVLRESRQYEVKSFLLMASDEVVGLLIDDESTNLAELEDFIQTPIRVQAESTYPNESYDIIISRD